MNGGQLIFKMLLKDKKKDDFRRMFCEYYPKLVRFAVQLTGDADEGRDVVADVMEKAWGASTCCVLLTAAHGSICVCATPVLTD